MDAFPKFHVGFQQTECLKTLSYLLCCNEKIFFFCSGNMKLSCSHLSTECLFSFISPIHQFGLHSCEKEKKIHKTKVFVRENDFAFLTFKRNWPCVMETLTYLSQVESHSTQKDIYH